MNNRDDDSHLVEDQWHEDDRLALIEDVDKAIADEDCNLSKLCYQIACNRGFRNVKISNQDAILYRSILHIGGELGEFHDEEEAERIDEAKAAEELADIVILLADLMGDLQNMVLLEEVKYNYRIKLWENPDKAAFKLMNAAYKHGLRSPEFNRAFEVFLNTVAYLGRHYAGSYAAFHKIVLEKCKKNLGRPYKFGLPTEQS